MSKFARESNRISITCGTEVIASAVVRALAGSQLVGKPEVDELHLDESGRAKVQGSRRQRRMAQSYNKSRGFRG